MPRNQGTSRKGKPKKIERESGMGRALLRSQQHKFKPKSNGSSRGAGMAASGATSIGFAEEAKHLITKSVLETDDLTDFLNRANLADKHFESEHEQFVIIDDTAHDIATIADSKKNVVRDAKDLQFDFTELSVPRRPKWDASTTPEELDRNEKEAFLSWRRKIAQFEEQVGMLSSSSSSSQFSKVTVTPFEKNIQVWRQLWRVLERSDIVVLIVDARNPLFYISLDLRKYVEEELGKYMMVILNKSDFLTEKQRLMWHMYFETMGLDHIFFSAYMEQLILDEEAKRRARLYVHDDDSEDENREEEDEDSNDSDAEEEDEEEDDDDEQETEPNDMEKVSNTANVNNDAETSPQAQDNTSNPIQNDNHSSTATSTTQTNLHQDRIGIHRPVSRKQLLELLLEFASLRGVKPNTKGQNNTTLSPRIEFGMVGFPNVGKSSVINVLVGASKNDHLSSRVAVAAQPGKTRHFQTLNVPDRDDFTLCDCPGLVFPSFVSSLADLILAGVYPLAQVRDFWPAMELICNRIPRDILEGFYGIDLPRPSRLDIAQAGKKLPLKPPTARQLLETYCISRSLLSAASGVPDHHRAARVMLGDYVNGRVLYCHCPPFPKISDSDTIKEDVSKQDQDKWNTAYLTETFHTTFERSKKLLNKNMSTSNTSTSKSKLNTVKEETDPSTTVNTSDGKFLEEENLDDMLDIVGSSEVDNKGGKRGKKHKTMQKWGKKDRKNRNKDPYGCHTEPDEELFRTSMGSGICVKAGKYGSSSYTRPTYTGARSAVAFEQTHETQ